MVNALLLATLRRKRPNGVRFRPIPPDRCSAAAGGVLVPADRCERTASAVSSRMGRRRPPLWRWCASVVVGVLAAVGCSAPGASLESTPEVTVRPVGALLRDPVWSYATRALIGLTDDSRVAAITDPLSADQAHMRLSAKVPTGRNLTISAKDNRHLYVPQPERGKVAVFDLGTLSQIDEFDAGPTPAYLAEDAGMRVLLALSADGLSVTPVDQYGFRKLPTAKVTGDPADTIDGANRGRQIGYHLYGPSGIRYFQGPSSPPEERGSLNMDVAVAAGDGAQVTRSYVAGRDGKVLFAVDSRRGGHGLELLAATPLPSPIRRIGTDDTRIYAATDREVAVLETDSFTGYPHKTLPVLRITNYRAALPAAARGAPVSGMAIGPHRVYLTLAGTPYLVSVAKPRL